MDEGDVVLVEKLPDIRIDGGLVYITTTKGLYACRPSAFRAFLERGTQQLESFYAEQRITAQMLGKGG